MRYRPGVLRRLGVVLSVLWFVTFPLWAWENPVDSERRAYLKMCLALTEIQDPKSSNDAYVEPTVCFDGARARYDYADRSVESSTIWLFILIDLVPIALAWLLAWIVIRVSRWVIGATEKVVVK
jgi:hypothetical protein